MKKLRKIGIEGFRGARFPLELDFDKGYRSMAIYGDNGGGKSTVTDAIEWFYTNRVSHLWKEDCKEECLRNTHSPGDKDALISLELNDRNLTSKKSLTPQYRSQHSNTNEDFKSYLEQSNKERLFLRYGDILRFILMTKGDKRLEILNIIGYDLIANVRAELKSACTDLTKDARFREVSSLLHRNAAILLEDIGQVVSTEQELYETANKMLEPLKLKIEIVDEKSFSESIEAVKTQSGIDPEKIERVSKLSEFKRVLEGLKEEITKTEDLDKFLTAYGEIIKDKEKIRKVDLKQLLEKGKDAITDQVVGADVCPLCLSTIDSSKVIKEIGERIQELEEISEEFEDANQKKGYALTELGRVRDSLDEAEKKRIKDDADYDKVTELTGTLKKSIEKTITDIGEKFTKLQVIEKAPQIFVNQFDVVKKEIGNLLPKTQAKILALTQTPEQKQRFETASKLENTKRIFDENKKLNEELNIFQKQLETLTKIRDDFINVQTDALRKVLNAISGDVDTFYRMINPEEGVEDIRLEVIGEEGVEFKYVFHGKESHPPLKYLSESHLNCLGICLFLASVRLFNRVNNFFLLDDVITSFDQDHRMPFLRLLQDHFSDYQVLLFTHERFWYQMMNVELKQFGWLFNDVSWSIEDGIYLKKSIVDTKERIEHKLDQGDFNVGNDLRKLLEQVLKEICFNLGAKVSFRYNEDNERRMAGELLSALRGKLNKEKCNKKDEPIFKRLATSSLVTSHTSHDSPPFESRGDVNVVREDIEELENHFFCPECKRYVGLEYADKAGKLVKCKCGEKELTWAFA